MRTVDDRFEVLSLAGEGGMGRVYRGRDLRDGTVVALKMLRDDVSTEDTVTRFHCEVEALAQLHDPAIVRYVAHGTAHDGSTYLAMQWIDGEELRLRLRRGPLDVGETLAVAARMAGALAHAHACGVIHRDVKPANIVLADEVLSRATLIDFGLARIGDHEVTHAGVLLGTPNFMAPEQARGHAVGPAVDVFSLGCVIYACLVGHSPFSAKGATAVLARVLFEEPAPLPDHVPAALAAVVTAMLRKTPEGRPSMGAVVEQLALLREPRTQPCTMSPRVESLGAREQRLVSVVVAGEPSTSDQDDTLRWGGKPSGAPDAARLHALATRFGAQSILLPDGTFIAVLSTQESAPDLAMRAGELALSLKRALRAPIGLATGRAEVGEGIPVGEAVDRAVALPPFHGDGVRVDGVTAALLDDRFVQQQGPDGTVVRKRRDLGPTRTLLGKPTPCVGRDAELAMLEGMLTQCIDESVARAVLVTAPAGFGKSRLRHELLRRVRAREDEIQIWTARADSIGGAPFGMIAQVIRQTCGIVEGESPAESRDKLRAHTGDPRIATFLGEIIGVDAGGGDEVQLRAARRDAMLMAEQMRRAFTDFVDNETWAGPLLIVLEDLHWGDLPSVSALDHALRLFRDRPLLVMAFARPEVHDAFPRLFDQRALQPMPLAALSKKAAERLVGSALPSAESAAQLVEQAGGNIFYLEELIRATAEGREAPPTVIAIVQSRLTRLDPRVRRVLRAASVFGETFWTDGVRALVGDANADDTNRTLELLVQSELCTLRATSRLARHTEYAFHHALVREGAYSMLTAEDARLGHRLAAEWLERAGETAAARIAEHYARGGEAARAAAWFLPAAEHALESNDLASAIDLAQRGVANGATDALLGGLRSVQAAAYLWRGETAAVERAAAEAVVLLPRRSAKWADALTALAIAKQRLGYPDELIALAQELTDDVPTDDVERGAHARAAARMSTLLLFAGEQALGSRVLAFAERVAEGGGREVQARIHHAHAPRARQAGRPAEALEHLEAAEAAFRDVGDEPTACLMTSNRGFSLSELGAYDEARPLLERALATAERLGLSTVAGIAKSNLAIVQLRLGDVALAEKLEREALTELQLRDRRQEGVALMYLALILLEGGNAQVAEGEARAALDLLEIAPPLRPHAAAILASALLAIGRAEEAQAIAGEAMDWVDGGGKIEEGDALLRLVHVRALFANGRRQAAVGRLRAAVERLHARAATISNPRWRRSFLENVPENRMTFELAAQSA